MNVQWINNPLPGRHRHKRFDTDEPVAKCPRLSESSGDAGLLGSSPGSPVSGAPLNVSPTHQGPTHIGQFLLVPLTDRPGVHSALDLDMGEELVCKVNGCMHCKGTIHMMFVKQNPQIKCFTYILIDTKKYF